MTSFQERYESMTDDERMNLSSCCANNDYKWPKHLSSGVMFWFGQRITIFDFKEYSSLFREASQ